MSAILSTLFRLQRMIAFLSGTVLVKELKSLILEVQGVGYRVFGTLELVTGVREGEALRLFTHQHVREDDLALFGFRSQEELSFFQKLISVSGIGPKTALDMLEVPVKLIAQAIEASDVDFLKSLKGIGKKTAERMIVELKGSLPVLASGSGGLIPAEVIQALTDLGFDRTLIQRKFMDAKIELTTPEEMVKWFLQSAAS